METFFLILSLFLIFWFFVSYFALGKTSRNPILFSEEDLNYICKKRKIFKNKNQNIIYDEEKRTNYLKFTLQYFFGNYERKPKIKIPSRENTLKDYFYKNNSSGSFTWLGHSSLLLFIEGKKILVDPVFFRASPIKYIFGERFQKPDFDLTILKDVDIILISHDHYDHLDYHTIKMFVDTEVQFICPLGVRSHLQFWGIESSRIKDCGWWETIEFGGIQWHCLPSQHYSGRTFYVKFKTLWASWAIISEKEKIYFSGDSGYGEHFKEIGKRFGGFDLCFVENGQYNEGWKTVHMFPEESFKAFKDLKGRYLIPIHWGMFNLSIHDWYEPIERIYRCCMQENCESMLKTPMIGEHLHFENLEKYKNTLWWQPLIKIDNSHK